LLKKLILVVGARPNFMKVAPLIRESSRTYKDSFQPVLVHTGQHYDPEMSETFFRDLEIPTPDYNLEVGSATHSVQTARIMERFEPVCEKENPDCVVVFGDVNSTLACTLVAVKNHIPVAHVEAGLRSFDRSMPEEVNRVVTDVLSEYLFTPDKGSDQNLLNEGISPERIYRVGDIMVDALYWERKRAVHSQILASLGLGENVSYGVVTLHRAGNVDDSEILKRLVDILVAASEKCLLIFPVHPRTRDRLKSFHLLNKLLNTSRNDGKGIILTKPVGYRDFLKLIIDSEFVMTDSGGIQKETTVLGIPCLTLRSVTEWPVTVSHGTNRLLGNFPSVEGVVKNISDLLEKKVKNDVVLPELWDGKTSERILNVLSEKL